MKLLEREKGEIKTQYRPDLKLHHLQEHFCLTFVYSLLTVLFIAKMSFKRTDEMS